MPERDVVVIDGNEAAASVAYRASEVIAIYPITPSSTMGELADEWAARGDVNVFGTVPDVVEMQSEAGAAGAVHGALQAGTLATTFTASQGLLLMIPNMYKIAGELTPFCMHVAARTIATHALSIFGDHSDVMACRQTGFAMIASASIQEAHDMALAAHAATLRARVPFLHFFDGFRTSHELQKVEMLSDEDVRALLDEEAIAAHRRRALTPDSPVIRGTAQNPDTWFQAREAVNRYYDACPAAVERVFEEIAARVGRKYKLFEYIGHPEAERVIVVMGSAAQTVEATVEHLAARGEHVGCVRVRLYRPFSMERFVEALPKTARALAVLDRTKEPGAPAEPLHLDVLAALAEARATGNSPFRTDPVVVGGRYGLSSKEVTPPMVKAVLDELGAERPRRRFTIGIVDDVTHLSLPVDDTFTIEPEDVLTAVFYGLGADGTVGANKASVKIIGEETPNEVQGYFVYDSKKSGAVTVSHLRFGPRPIRAPYLVKEARFVACHQWGFFEFYEIVEHAAKGGVLLLNAPYEPGEVFAKLPLEAQQGIIEKRLKVYAIDATRAAMATGMGARINTIMQTCFFAVSGVLPRDEAIARIKGSIEKTYAKKGREVIEKNFAAVDATLAHLHEVPVPAAPTATRGRPPRVSPEAPPFVQRVTAVMLAGKGDLLPVSAFPADGTWPTGTAKWEKRNIAIEIPVWDEAICIQCNKCAFVCPHTTIRAKTYEPAALAGAPATFKSTDWRDKERPGLKYTIQVAAEDCTGCGLCVQVCPAKDKSNPRHKAIDMAPQPPLREAERANYAFFLDIPDPDRATVKADVKGSQLLEPLFEYSGACAGCGETPYIKLLTQLYGDRTLIANATGCSSIYGGNLPTTPYTTNRDGRGPAWSNSLFEDNAEFGLGFRLAVDKHADHARTLLRRLAPKLDADDLVRPLLEGTRTDEAAIREQRERVVALRKRLEKEKSPEARRLDLIADALVHKSVWIVGGDGWAYDIGFGGLDHVISLGRKVNILVLDTEVYSNTGGQQSKATPLGAAAKFAVAGKAAPKKDLGLMAMTYGTVYVARVAFGAKDLHTLKVFQEAESFPGPALVIAYSPCIAHGYDLAMGADHQKLAVDSGHWPLFRYDPRRVAEGKNPLELDSAAPKIELARYVMNETRFRMVEQRDPARWRDLLAAAQREAKRRYEVYERMAGAAAPAAPAAKQAK